MCENILKMIKHHTSLILSRLFNFLSFDQSLICPNVFPGSHQVGDKLAVTFDMSSISASDNVQRSELRIRLPAFASEMEVDIYHASKRECDPKPLQQSTDSPWLCESQTDQLKHIPFLLEGLQHHGAAQVLVAPRWERVLRGTHSDACRIWGRGAQKHPTSDSQ